MGYWARAAIPFVGRLPLSWFFAIPIMLVLSLYHLSGHLLEQRRRDLLLTQGHDTQALVRGPTGIEFATVEWSDAGGRTRAGLA